VNGNEARFQVTGSAAPVTVGHAGDGFNPPALRIQLVGRVAMACARTVTDERLLHGRQAALIFALLVMVRNRPVRRDELAEALWPHGLPRTWGPALRSIVSKVRAFLTVAGLPESMGPCSGFGGYQLRLPADVVVDVEFARLAVETAEQMLRGADVERAIALADYAREVTIAPFLPDATGRWVDGVRGRLRKVLVWALSVLSDGHGRLGRHDAAVQAAEEAIALEPFRERTHQLLMRVHASAGNPAEALRAYDRWRRLLADELGAHPASETQSIHLALLRNGSLEHRR
jgi:DNA-binding SARP family transcriptional activator